MRRPSLPCFVAFLSFIGMQPSFGQHITAIRPIPGLACMALKMTEAQMRDPSFIVPILTAPHTGAPSIGEASAIVIVVSPPRDQNGYRQAVLLDGRQGWISIQAIQPWASFGPTKQECVPSLMSNGRLGFDFRNL